MDSQCFRHQKIVFRLVPVETSVLKEQSQLDLDEVSEDFTETVKYSGILLK